MPTDPHEYEKAHPLKADDPDHPGYEVKDVNIGGIVTFLAGLAGFVVIFFFFCFVMGKAIDYALAKHDGPSDKWHADEMKMGSSPTGKREDLTSDATMEQRELQQMTQIFPTPRLETDDGEQDLADLHAREDLLLDNYSSSPDLPVGTIRIPIGRAMQLIVQRGLPQAPQAQPEQLMAGDAPPLVQAPLTDGFARTGYELQTIAAREQKNEYEHAEAQR
jgi:hypothetical protein